MTDAYAAYHREEAIRMQSSSGGVFYALACGILEEGGIVFGAAFDENFHVVYKSAETKEELSALRGAKYVFPRIGSAYKEVQACLEQGKKVLFSGLPCHGAGLLNFLGKPEENLCCVDMVCHGAPEEAVWDAYLDALRGRIGTVKNVRMRGKQKGWSFYQVEFQGNKGKTYRRYAEEDPYMQGFLRDLYLRGSCYRCPMKGVSRRTDITLGDYWGGGALHGDMDDDKGISLVLLHTEKGRSLFTKVQKSLVWSKTDIQYAIENNPSLVQAAERPKDRDGIVKKIKQGAGFFDAVAPFLCTPLTKKSEKKCRRVWRMWKRRMKNMGKLIRFTKK